MLTKQKIQIKWNRIDGAEQAIVDAQEFTVKSKEIFKQTYRHIRPNPQRQQFI